jgi:hypothetical protein
MTTSLPEPREAQQLCRLRTLRVQRAREHCAQAQAEVARAAQAVRDRQRLIEHGRGAMQQLAHDVVHALAPRLPRWSTMASAQRERLADRLERDEYALISDQERLEESQERLQQARADLTRALAREDAVRGLAQQVRRSHALARERLVERELDDQARASGNTRARTAA